MIGDRSGTYDVVARRLEDRYHIGVGSFCVAASLIMQVAREGTCDFFIKFMDNTPLGGQTAWLMVQAADMVTVAAMERSSGALGVSLENFNAVYPAAAYVLATLAKKMQRRFDKDAPLRPYLAPTPLRNRTPPPVDENLAAQIAANDGKVAMPRDVETCVSRVHQSLKRVKAAQSFRTPIETERWTDYEPKVGGQALDLTSVEHSFKRGAFQQDCGAWVLRMRRISANCLRYNTDTRFPELRQDAKFYLKVRILTYTKQPNNFQKVLWMK